MASFLTRFDPFNDLARLAPVRDIDDMWRDLRHRYQGDGLEMRLDVAETDKAYTVRADLPGVNKEDIKVDVDGNRVSISAEIRKESEEKEGSKIVRSERYVGRQYRSFMLDHAIDDTAAKAKYENGVLELTLPKKASASGHKLQIT